MTLTLSFKDALTKLSPMLVRELETLLIRFRVGWNEKHQDGTPSAMKLTDAGGTVYYVWVDTTGDLRVGTTAPTATVDTGGTIVGTQS